MAANKWFKMGDDIMNTRVMRKVLKLTVKHDSGAIFRRVCLEDLFSASAMERAFDDVTDLAERLGYTLKQCQIVWDICIEEGVLRETKQGWNAYDWLLEEGFIGDWKSKRVTPPPPPREAFSNKKEESLFDNF